MCRASARAPERRYVRPGALNANGRHRRGMSSPYALKPIKPLPAPGVRPQPVPLLLPGAKAAPLPQPLKSTASNASIAPLATPAARPPLGMPAAVPLPAPPQLRQRSALSPPGASPGQPAPLPKPPQPRSPLPPLQPAASTAALPQPSRPPPQPPQQPPPVSGTDLNSWVTCVAEDGTPYFYHPASGNTSWDWRDGGAAYGAQAYGSTGSLPAATRAPAPLARQLSAMPNDVEWDVVLVLPLPQQEVPPRPCRPSRTPPAYAQPTARAAELSRALSVPPSPCPPQPRAPLLRPPRSRWSRWRLALTLTLTLTLNPNPKQAEELSTTEAIITPPGHAARII